MTRAIHILKDGKLHKDFTINFPKNLLPHSYDEYARKEAVKLGHIEENVANEYQIDILPN